MQEGHFYYAWNYVRLGKTITSTVYGVALIVNGDPWFMPGCETRTIQYGYFVKHHDCILAGDLDAMAA